MSKIGISARKFVATTSTIALACGLPSVAFAQDQGQGQDGQSEEVLQPDDENAIVVTGIRQSLQSADDIKRNADTFVDAITASDTSALPDRSVSEALQRVPGVSIIRFAGPDDPDHFSVEGSGTVIRGLPFVRSELNSRDVFGASSGGTLGFQDVSPELLGSVQVFKNSTADLIEGGIAGTIDLRTRLPFDQRGRVLAFSAEATYSDLVDEWTPAISGLYSDRFSTGIGDIGFLVNASFNQLDSRADAVQIGEFRNSLVQDSQFNNDPATFEGPIVPGRGGVRTQVFDRQRIAVAGALQWESLDGRWLASAQFLRSDAEVNWNENVLQIDGVAPTDAVSADSIFDEDEIFTSGLIVDTTRWRGPPATAALFPDQSTGGQLTSEARERFEDNETTDFGFNLKFAATDRLRFNFDAQYIESTNQAVDANLALSTFAAVGFNVDENGVPFEQTGQVPDIRFFPPPGDGPGFFADPSNFFVRNILQFIQDNEADSFAFRGDVEYDLSDDGFFRAIRGGVRYNEQDTLLRESTFNWSGISEVWTGQNVPGGGGTPGFATQVSTLQVDNPNLDPSLFGTASFANFQRGGAGDIGLGAGLVSFNGPLAGSFEEFAQFEDLVRELILLGNDGQLDESGNPISISGNRTLSDRPNVIPGTPFLPSEISTVDRDTFAAYARLDFGLDSIGGSDIEVSGNIGLRYVDTQRRISQNFSIPALSETPFVVGSTQQQLCPPNIPPTTDGGEPQDVPGFCQIDPASVAGFFGDGVEETSIVSNGYDEFLPSFNVRFDFGGGHNVRLAASRTLSRPDVTQLREVVGFDILQDNIDLTLGETPDGRDINVFQGFTVQRTGNTELLPQTSWGFDASYEYYFGNPGSIRIGFFHKIIEDFINISAEDDDIVGADGSVISVIRNVVAPAEENATLTGFEVGYNQFFDFLPGPLSGLGLQANYTYIDSDFVANEIDSALDPNVDGRAPLTPRFDIDANVFPRVSDHNFNIIGLYEKYGFQGRVAFNYRSSFQVTPIDVIRPFAAINQPATGQLDASIFYDLTDNFKIGVQAVNLLDDVTETTATNRADGTQTPRSFFRNDRRFSFLLRGNF